MLETIIVILLVLWLVGYFGGSSLGLPAGNLVHVLLVIVLILILFRYL